MQYFFFLIIVSFILAKLEIQIEGKHGWAKKLPTWKIKNVYTNLLLGHLPLTGYHLWLLVFLFAFVQFPFIMFGQWSVHLELRSLAVFFAIPFVEDFFWILLNPHYGWKRFHQQYIYWHKKWIAKIPLLYYQCSLASISLLLLSSYLH